MNWTLHLGSALDVLRTLPEASAHCVLTSPPYFGLRDYGTAEWRGGRPDCVHALKVKPRNDTTGSGVDKGRFSATRGTQPSKSAPIDSRQDRSRCACGAARVDLQIGMEESPDAYVGALVDVFREARRVLAPTGVLLVNLGDSYANDGKWGGASGGKHVSALHGDSGVGRRKRYTGLKRKDLIGIPWAVAFALRADGWYLRSAIVWAKPNPMPESVKDRPTKAHEDVFLLTKSPRYFWNADAIREKYAESTLKEFAQGYDGEGTKDYDGAGVQNPSSVKARIVAKARRVRAGVDHKGGNQGSGIMTFGGQIGANARTVWTIPTEPSPYDHSAVMPKALARKCILAGCPPGGTVVDPFAGMATTGVVALEEGRSFVGIELSPKYHAMARQRLSEVAPLLASERTEAVVA